MTAGCLENKTGAKEPSERTVDDLISVRKLLRITSTYSSGGSWGSMEDVSTAGNNAYNPVIGVDSSGNLIAAWLETNSSSIDVVATANGP